VVGTVSQIMASIVRILPSAGMIPGSSIPPPAAFSRLRCSRERERFHFSLLLRAAVEVTARPMPKSWPRNLRAFNGLRNAVESCCASAREIWFGLEHCPVHNQGSHSSSEM
jgi:hypothetical protein